MPRLRQNDSERAVGMVQVGMTHPAIADHFNVSRITISTLMIRLRQTGKTNNRPVTADSVWRHDVKTDIYALFTPGTVW
jgi:transposase